MNIVTTSYAPLFDSELIARHDIQGPRYTSYPTAPQFSEGFGEIELRATIRASNEDPIPRALSLYVHVPFCTSPCFYCGCNRVITRDRSKAESYLSRLYREIERMAPLFDRDRQVKQLHFGGGTPNFLNIDQMAELLGSLSQHFSLTHAMEREFGIELDPREANAEYVAMLAQHGFNRLSVGIQDFDPDVQVAINRVQSVEQTQCVLEAARQHHFRSVSVDLIYGLPKQTPERFARTLEQVIALRPDRVVTYSYAHLPERFKAQRQIDSADLPDAATRLALLGCTIEMLTAAGYRYIGMDHFALPADDLAQAQDKGMLQRNFQGYSTHADCDLIGLGVSSISHIGATFSQNAKDVRGYFAALDSGQLPVVRGLALRNDDVIRADIIQRLMCHARVDIAAFETRYGINFASYFAVELKKLLPLEAEELLHITPSLLIVTSRGRFLLRIIAMCFDAYLTPSSAEGAQYSKAL